jgi:nucleoside-diphosphate-sugar epimerase
MKCLVTGATGFIGRELCGQLEARSVSFTALSLHGNPLSSGHVTVALDLSIQQIEPELLAGVDVVYHLAGIAHQKAESERYRRVNHQATVDLAAAAASAGVKVFVFLSSVKAMGAPEGVGRREETDCSWPRDAYGVSKRSAELDLQSAYAGSEMSVVTLRPALVYGAGAGGNLRLLARGVRAGMPRPPELGGRSMIALEDLVGLLVLLATQCPAGSHTWIVCDGHRYTARRIHDLMRMALARPPARSWLPTSVWRLSCVLLDLLTKSERGSTFGKIFGTELYSSAALQSALAWRPSIEFGDAVGGIMKAGLDRESGVR